MRNLHLILSCLIIIPLAIAYGLSPDLSIPYLPEINANNIDLKNIMRAIMGLYLAMVVLWLIGIILKRFWLTATITNVFFMGGLALGRSISYLVDGKPSMNFFIGTFVEIIFALWGIYNLKKYGTHEVV